MTVPTRPILRYHGGKWKLADWFISHFPPHRTYVEPFGGAASVLMRKSRTYAEVYNDLDSEVVNVFRVMRDRESAEQLADALRMTPFAREEFEAAYMPPDDATAVERARLTIVKAFMGFGSAAIHDTFPAGMRTAASEWRPPTGFRSSSSRSGSTPARDWSRYPAVIPAFCERLQGVVIECRPATHVIAHHDSPATLFYVDPPYLGELRNRNRAEGKVYTHDMTTEDEHRELAEVLRGVSGHVVISGYPSELYDELYSGWTRLERGAFADGASPRREVLWISPGSERLELFA